jgi:hypothetical protein
MWIKLVLIRDETKKKEREIRRQEMPRDVCGKCGKFKRSFPERNNDLYKRPPRRENVL